MSGLVLLLRLAVMATLTLLVVRIAAQESFRLGCEATQESFRGCEADTCSNGGGNWDVILKYGVVITSKNKKIVLKMENSGILELLCQYGPSSAGRFWTSDNSYNYSMGNVAKFESDGNIVIYENGNPSFSTSIGKKGGARLVLQNDANLVIYTKERVAIWSSQTKGQCE